ncbi:MAG: toxin-antitoxin system HicB family antitoxin [Gammaproteobacteria bacterium]|nr:toxin-antitoxin system HicB family antitoxin [Gammaproteobacteria bacterium]
MTQHTLSGRFVLRLGPDLHAELRREAAIRGISLNAHCVQRLAAPNGVSPGFEGAAEAVRRATELMGEALVGIAVFGSWARGEPADTSDVDVLIVIDGDVPITRHLYRRWDEAPVAWDGRPVDPHFVHLPPQRRTPSGLWAEVAIDGIVLHDPRHRLFPQLAAVRRALAEGRLRRRTVHGVGYWTEPV